MSNKFISLFSTHLLNNLGKFQKQMPDTPEIREVYKKQNKILKMITGSKRDLVLSLIHI